MFRIINLHKQFGPLKVLRGIHCEINPGELVLILGPNGAGKTTFIKSLLGLVKPDQGEIYFQNQKITQNFSWRKEITYMPQISFFPPNLTPTDLIQFFEKLRGKAPLKEQLIELFQMANYLHKPMGTLSGGMRQKVSLLLALMFDVPCYILDEPNAGLDPVANQRLKNYLLETNENGKTFIITTHMLHFGESIATRLLFLLDGIIHFDGTVSQLLTETNAHSLEEAIAKRLTQTQYVTT